MAGQARAEWLVKQEQNSWSRTHLYALSTGLAPVEEMYRTNVITTG
jgi:hypothetical protein